MDCFLTGTSKTFDPKFALFLIKDMNKSLQSSQELDQSVSLLAESSVGNSTTNSEFIEGIGDGDVSTQQHVNGVTPTPQNTPAQAGKKRKEPLTVGSTGDMKKPRELSLEEVQTEIENLSTDLIQRGVDDEDEDAEMILPDIDADVQVVVVSESMN